MFSRMQVAVQAFISTTVFCVLYIVVSSSLYTNNTLPAIIDTPNVKPLPVITGSPSVEAPMVIVVCDSVRNNTSEQSLVSNATTQEEYDKYIERISTSWARQAEQITTMLKTLLYFSRSPVWRIIVITDTLNTFNKVVNLTRVFPQHHIKRLVLHHHNIWFPDNYPELKDSWRPCVWAKLFLAEILPKENRIVYVDTDMVFLRPPEELWLLLKLMKEQQVVSLSPEPQYLKEDPRRYYAGRVGLNTGVMAANLKKMRELPGGGLGSAILQEGAITPPPRHDQDALNHFLMNKPHLLQEVTSRWNFLPSSCFPVAPPCPDCLSQGINVLHGADTSFYKFVDEKFKLVYAILVRLRLNDDPRTLLRKMKDQLGMTDSWSHLYPCSNYTHIDQALTLGLTHLAYTSDTHTV